MQRSTLVRRRPKTHDAYDIDEYMTGVRCIGGPVFGSAGKVVAGIGVMGPSYRLPLEVLEGFAPIVKEAAARLSGALGNTNW